MRRSQDYKWKLLVHMQTMRKVIGHLANGSSSISILILRNVKPNVLNYIIVSTDRSLCGGLNINLFKESYMNDMKDWSERC